MTTLKKISHDGLLGLGIAIAVLGWYEIWKEFGKAIARSKK